MGSAKIAEARMASLYGVINAGAGAAQAALTAVGGAFVAMGAGAFVALGATQQFQNEMTTLRALSGITKDEMFALYETVNDVATAFGVSGDEIAAGTVTLAKAGLSIDEINESISAMTALARANGVAFDQAAEITVFAVETFGRSFSESGEMMDAMQVAAQESILDIEDLQSAFAYAGSTAMMTGVSFEQLISLMATLSNRALAAGISSRSLNKMFIDILENADTLDAFMSSMGTTFEIIKDGKLDIDAMIAAFSEQTLTIDMLMEANDIFTVRALRAFGLLVGASDDYAEMLDKVNNSTGALAGVAGVMMESFLVQFGQTKQAFLGMLRSEEVIGALTLMVSELNAMMLELKPQIIGLIVNALAQFVNLLQSDTLKHALSGAIDLLSLLYNAFVGVYEVLTIGESISIKWAIGIMLMHKVLTPLAMTTMPMFVTQTRLAATTTAALSASMSFGILGIVMMAESSNTLIQVIGGLVTVYAALTAGIWAYNTAQAAQISLQEAKWMVAGTAVGGKSRGLLAQSGGAGIMRALGLGGRGMLMGLGVGGLVLGGGMLLYSQMKKNRERREAEMAALMPTADTGMFFTGRSTYDTGGVAPRHQLAYIEPGEQIVSKTQGMVGMGGGVTVNVGDVYARDGTDFAEKLAEALPRALRRTSYGGGF